MGGPKKVYLRLDLKIEMQISPFLIQDFPRFDGEEEKNLLCRKKRKSRKLFDFERKKMVLNTKLFFLQANVEIKFPMT